MSEPTLYPPPRPLTVGEVLDLSFRIYRRTFVKCLLFGALLVVVNWLPNLYAVTRGQTVVQSVVKPVVDSGHLIALLVTLVLAFLFPLAILYRQYKLITGQEPGGELLRALRLLGRTLLMMLLLGLVGAACGLLLIPIAFASGLARYALAVLLLLPMGYVFLRLACSMTVLVVEDAGAKASLSRSWELAAGNVLRLMAIYTVALFLLFVMYIVVGAVTGFLYAVVGHGDVALIAAALGVVWVLVGALASPWYSALGLAIYGDLLVRKEGADLSQRISAA
jgi:hypothetical protein